jgi:hypothetical protein
MKEENWSYEEQGHRALKGWVDPRDLFATTRACTTEPEITKERNILAALYLTIAMRAF